MIKLKKISWSEQAAEGLSEALGEQLNDIAAEVKADIAELWRVGNNGRVVTRLELHSEYTALVLVAGEGWADGKNGYLETVKAFSNLAANVGADRVEVETNKKAIGRMVESIGFVEVSRKYELNLDSIKAGDNGI